MTEPTAQSAQTSPVAARTERATWRGRLGVFLLLFLLPLGLRVASLDHGLPRGYVPDAHIVRNALGMASDRDPVPRAGEYSTYPNLLPYMLLPVYAGYYVVGSAQDRWSSPDEFGDHILTHPGTVHYLARWLVALFGALTPWIIFRTARAAGMRHGAWAAAWLAATCLLSVQLSTHERPWVPLVFFSALCFWPAVYHARVARMRTLLLCGASAGLAFATHQAGLLVIGIPAFVWLFSPLGWRGEDLKRRLTQGLACVALFLLVGVLIGHPYLLVHGRARAEEVMGGPTSIEQSHLSLGGQPVRLGFSLDTFRRLSRAFMGYDPLLVILGLMGWLATFRRRELRAALAWTTVWGLFFLTHDNDHVRYLLPAALGLALPAGMAIERMLKYPRARWLVALLLLFPFVQSVRLVQLTGIEDTRVEAENRLFQLPLGSVVVIDRYGPEVDLSLDALVRLKGLRARQNGDLYARERKRMQLLRAGTLEPGAYGLDVIPMEDVCTFHGGLRVRPGLLELGDTPAAAFRALGATHLLLVETEFDADAARHLAGELVAGREPVWSISPAPAGSHVQAKLPMELESALSTIWAAERPGPRLSLYSLR
ncbi:MAG: hypothetical protein ACI8QZ_001419 [Chlamydiales bacterium]|jgi:hypothetical protein